MNLNYSDIRLIVKYCLGDKGFKTKHKKKILSLSKNRNIFDNDFLYVIYENNMIELFHKVMGSITNSHNQTINGFLFLHNIYITYIVHELNSIGINCNSDSLSPILLNSTTFWGNRYFSKNYHRKNKSIKILTINIEEHNKLSGILIQNGYCIDEGGCLNFISHTEYYESFDLFSKKIHVCCSDDESQLLDNLISMFGDDYVGIAKVANNRYEILIRIYLHKNLFLVKNQPKINLNKNYITKSAKFDGFFELKKSAYIPYISVQFIVAAKSHQSDCVILIHDFVENFKTMTQKELIANISVSNQWQVTAEFIEMLNYIKEVVSDYNFDGLVNCYNDEFDNVIGYIYNKYATKNLFIPKIIRQNIVRKSISDDFLYYDAYNDSKKYLHYLKKNCPVDKLFLSGELRRKSETVKIIDIIILKNETSSIHEYILEAPLNNNIILVNNNLIILTSRLGIKYRFIITNDLHRFVYLNFIMSSSKSHVQKIRSLIKVKGGYINSKMLFLNTETSKVASEADIYNASGLKYIEPHFREDIGEIRQVQNSGFNFIIKASDIKGVFHIHTNYSDGYNSIEDYIKYAINKGLQYIGISDHSKSFVTGLDENSVLRQFEEIEMLQKKYNKIKIFKGIESNILENGNLDYNNDILKLFDFVIASLHTQNEAYVSSRIDMTDRIIKAVQNPHTTMLGHPSGKLLFAGSTYQLDIKRVIKECIKHQVIIEYNTNPLRLDLNWMNINEFIDTDIRISINPDAHSIKDLKFLKHGTDILRKSMLPKSKVINSMTIEDIAHFI